MGASLVLAHARLASLRGRPRPLARMFFRSFGTQERALAR